MPHRFINYFILFVVMLLVQSIICNHIILFGVAFPLIFIYFIVRLPMSLSINYVIILSFIMGFCVDLFSDTLGMNTLACTILSVLRKPIFNLYHSKDEELAQVIPSISSLGLAGYIKYIFSIVLVYCCLIITIEYFSFSNFSSMLMKIIGSSLLTFILLLGIDSIMIERREKRL